jgi:hypothetical protein
MGGSPQQVCRGAGHCQTLFCGACGKEYKRCAKHDGYDGCLRSFNSHKALIHTGQKNVKTVNDKLPEWLDVAAEPRFLKFPTNKHVDCDCMSCRSVNS